MYMERRGGFFVVVIVYMCRFSVHRPQTVTDGLEDMLHGITGMKSMTLI